MYEKLVPLTEDKFWEAFIESAPQMILQLKIMFGSSCPWSTLYILVIVTSFFNLAVTVTNHSLKFRQKNPSLRQATSIGKMFLILSKAPFMLSRCLSIAIIFSIPQHGVYYGFSAIAFGTLIFTIFEYLQMTSRNIAETRSKCGSIRFLIRLMIRGYLSNYSLLEDRLVKYDGQKWCYQSDEPYSEEIDIRVYRHRMIYLNVLSLFNSTVAIMLYTFPASEFNMTSVSQTAVASTIILGGLFSSLFTILYQSTKHYSVLSELGPQAMYILHIYLMDCYRNNYEQFLDDA